MSFWQRLLDSNQALPFIMAKKLLANQQNQCVLLCVPQSLILRLFRRQVHVRHICAAVTQQLGHLQLCLVLRGPAIHGFPVLPGRIAVPHPVVRQRPGVATLIRAVLPKERLKSMDIGIRDHIVQDKQLMPPLNSSLPVTQRLLRRLCRYRCRLLQRHLKISHCQLFNLSQYYLANTLIII